MGPLAPGAEVADFRVERTIGAGPRGAVYEATQLSLNRRVALKLLLPDPELAERFRHLPWPEHASAVSIYAAGACREGHFVAMQLVRGPTLAELQEGGRLEPARALEILTEVATALDAAHRAGIVHGAVGAQNVLVDGEGHAFLSDFGLGAGEASAGSDRSAFVALVGQCLGPGLAVATASSAAAIVGAAAGAMPRESSRERENPRRWRRAAGAATAGLAGLLAVMAVVAGSGQEPQQAPPVLPGAKVLGSALPEAGVRSVDCNGHPPSGASLPCTVIQTRLPGRALVAHRAGVIRRWAVRGAHGKLALQVVRQRGERFDAVARSPYESVRDEGIHLIPANLPVRAGDLIGVEVTPSAAIGVRREVGGAATARWFGPLDLKLRGIERGEGSGFDHELLLRVEYVPGAEWSVPGRLTGRAAELAPDGRDLVSVPVDISGGGTRRVTALRLRDRLAVDLFAGERRLTRLLVAEADPRGRLIDMIPFRERVVRLEWRNPDGRRISHDYAVHASALVPRS